MASATAINRLARKTRTALFGRLAPNIRAEWDEALASFQGARDAVGGALIEFDFDLPGDSTLKRDLIALSDEMDATASAIQETSSFGGGVPARSLFTLSGIGFLAAPLTIFALDRLTARTDQLLNRLPAVPSLPALAGVNLGESYTPWGSFGGDVWEWWHAETVQKEYEAVGKTAPPIEEIESGALQDAARDAREGALNIAAGFSKTLVLVAVIAVAVFVVPRVLPKK